MEDLENVQEDTKLISAALEHIVNVHKPVVALCETRKASADSVMKALKMQEATLAKEVEALEKEMADLKKQISTLGHPGWIALNAIPVLGSIAHGTMGGFAIGKSI